MAVNVRKYGSKYQLMKNIGISTIYSIFCKMYFNCKVTIN